MRHQAYLGLFLLSVASTNGLAQTAASASPSDSLFRRARRMVSEGNGTAGRALVDSLLRRETQGTSAYGDALYWRGALAETAAEAERDYRRVIVEYPLSYYADDALLAIAELEQARGDRAGALKHLQRFVREHPVSSARGIAALAAARLAFEQRDPRTGCAMIVEARGSASASDVELKNQVEYYSSRCSDPALPSAVSMSTPARDTATVSSQSAKPKPKPKATTATAEPAKSNPVAVPGKPTTKPVEKAPVAAQPVEKAPVAVKPVEKSPAQAKTTEKAPAKAAEVAATKAPETPAVTKPRGIYTIQLAAYNTQADAERLAAKLATKGVTARVSGTTKPFRVRLDFYPTRQAAEQEVASLKERGIIGFVTTEARTP